LGDSPDGEAFRRFQKFLQDLTARGVLLAACSKNNPEDARAPFERNPHMVLRLDHFAAFEASWDPKAVAIRRIAANLNLSTDSFVFVDDNPAEREHVRQSLPDVAVVELANDPADFVAALEKGMWFESTGLTVEDQHRSERYQAERKRKEAQSPSKPLDEYLQSLRMAGEVRPFGPEDVPRIVQLIGKTNQFNLTTRRHGREFVIRAAEERDAMAFSLRVTDRFGDYGLVSVLMAFARGDTKDVLEIDTWLMSCRVIGRTAEHFFFNHLAREAVRRGYRSLVGTYVPTGKNVLVRGLYPSLGFQQESTGEGLLETYRLDLSDWRELPTHLTNSDGRRSVREGHRRAPAA
jgi:FkbH-like protein